MHCKMFTIQYNIHLSFTNTHTRVWLQDYQGAFMEELMKTP